MLSDAKEEKIKLRDFDLNECAAFPDTAQLIDPWGEKTGMVQVNGLQIETYSRNCVKVECKNESLADNGMVKNTNGDDMEGLTNRKMKKVKLEIPHGDVRITRRVLRSSSAAAREDPERSDGHHVSVEEKREGDIEGKLSGLKSCDEVKTEVIPKHGQSPKVKEVHRADFKSAIEVEHKDTGSCDKDGNVVSHDEKQKFKRKRGRPRKLKISSPYDDGGSRFKCEPGGSPYLCSQQSNADGLKLRRRGRPPKTEETVEGPCIRGKKIKRKRGRPPKLPNRNISDSVDESRRQKSNCQHRLKGQESDGVKRRGRKKIVRKRGRPPKPRKETSSGETDDSDSEAKNRSKIHISFSESQASNPSVDGEAKIGVQETYQSKPGKQSISGAKKLLRDRILQLLLAAGWKVEYRPRNGHEYSDAVYVNPEGKTHWSVTLAYKVYRKQVESCMNDKKIATGGSNFALLSEEELHILERKVQKRRCDKGKKRLKLEDRDDPEDTVTVKIMGQRKLHPNKLQKERLRMQKLKLSMSYHTRPLQKKLKESRQKALCSDGS